MKIITTTLFIFLVSIAKAQTGIYKTYEDYVNGNRIVMDSIVDFERSSLSAMKIFFVDTEGKIKKITSKNMWGFVFNGHLFKSIGMDIANVVDTGKICYYENGIAHLKMIMDNSNTGKFYMGGIYYLSLSLNSKYYTSFKKLFKAHSELKVLKECIKKEATMMWMVDSDSPRYESKNITGALIQFRACIHKFNSN